MNSTQPAPELLQTRQHYLVLDGLRGVAALGVLIFHFMEIAIPDFSQNFIAHGYLAVDFFFCLSGFVIAYAYDSRLEKIGLGNFFKLRLIRLHPLVIIGSVIGLLGFMLDPFSDLQQTTGNVKTFLMFICSCFMIPYPAVPERFSNFFHLNAPTWSLFWEYMANIVYALVLVRIRGKLLWLLAIPAVALLWWESHRSGNISVGWGLGNFWGGGIRVFYSFLIGMLIYRSSWIINTRIPFPVIGVLLFLGLMVPFNESTTWWVDPLVVMLWFPLLVALGAGAQVSGRAAKICRFFGEISYPLYMVHYPFMWIFYSYTLKYQPPLKEMIFITIIGSLLLIALAYLVLKFVDEPIRTYFRKKMSAKGQ
ncbi:MAG TPA: acyltransferase [Flavihumibacter sp.]|jgi:peptidoglycan/LPS O-acetylase OafA/YrhL